MYDEAEMGLNNIISKSVSLVEESSKVSSKFEFDNFKANIGI